MPEWLRNFINLILPPRCLVCGKILSEENGLCEECFKKTLGKFILVDPSTLEKIENVKEENVNGGDAKDAKAEKKESAAKKQSNKKEGEEK